VKHKANGEGQREVDPAQVAVGMEWIRGNMGYKSRRRFFLKSPLNLRLSPKKKHFMNKLG